MDAAQAPALVIPRIRNKANDLTNRTILILNSGLPGGSHDDRHGGPTSEQVRDACATVCAGLDIDLEFRQTDDQEQMLRSIASDGIRFSALILSPAGPVDPERYSAAVEAMSRSKIPVIEVHPGNVFLNNGDAYKPLPGPAGATGFVCGMGLQGYLLAIRAIAKRLQR